MPDMIASPVMVTEAPAGVPAPVVGRLATPDLATVAYVPSPHRRQAGGVAHDLLQALGKDNDVHGKSRHSTGEIELVSLWLTAHRTRLVIPTACQHTSARDLLDLIEMTQASPANLLFAVDHGYADRTMQALHAAAPVRVPWPNIPDHHPGGEHVVSKDGFDNQHRQTLPHVEYWIFYATAKRQLSVEEFTPVHDLYCDTMRRVLDWLTKVQTTGQSLTVEQAHGCLKTLIEEQATFDSVTTVIRAAQAAHHRCGWFLDVDERELRNGLIRFPTTKTTPDLYDRLRAYREPARAGTVALYLAGATPAAIAAVTVEDLAQWRADPEQIVAGVNVPDEAAPYLRATLLARANDGNKPEDPAFPGDKRRVNLDIRQAASDLDLNIGDANLNKTNAHAERRVPRTIVRLEALT